MKEAKEAMKAALNEISYWVFLFVVFFATWIFKLIHFIKHYPSLSIFFGPRDVFVLITFPIVLVFFTVRIIVLIKRKRRKISESKEQK